MIVLADQCPWAGGLMRLKAVLGNPRYSAGEVRYFFQDADCPWVQDVPAGKITTGKWPEYWAMCWRYPWVLDSPQAVVRPVVESLKTPFGLDLLHGPNIGATILSHQSHEAVTNFVKAGFQKELAWARQLAALIGINVKVPDFSPSGIFDATDRLAETIGIPPENRPKTGLIELLRDDPSRLKGQTPAEHFWWINAAGHRAVADPFASPQAGTVWVPKGPALVLEFASRGWMLGITHLGYLEEALKLRDRLVPGLKIQILQVEFDWKLSADPVELQVVEYLKKKQARGQSVVPPAQGELEKIRQYWAGRPTPLSYSLLGGELNPRFTEKIL